MKTLNGIVFSDLASQCTPQENISRERIMGKWNAIEYETAEVKGTLLGALHENRPEPVELNPHLTGWHRIYIGTVITTSNVDFNKNIVPVRLTSDAANMHFTPYQLLRGGGIEDTFWKCADMTGESVIISKYPNGAASDVIIGWLRFEPMADEEASAYLSRVNDPQYKRLYATNDMHCMGCSIAAQTQQEWDSLVQLYEQSDVEWLSVENLFTFNGQPKLPLDQFSFSNQYHEFCQKTFKDYYTDDMLKGLVQLGHKLGLKMCASHRMGAWCVEYTWDEMYFENTFRHAHMNLRCMDRDGQYVEAMSYIYPEVQDYIIGMFTRLAKLGFDAVEMMYHRGVPYVLFEPPFIEAFIAKYGEDPRHLPLDDERVMKERCEVMTGFVRRLRKALDEACPERKVGLHARGQYSLYECRLCGEDMERWAREGLITAIISYPQFVREDLSGDVWQDGNPGHIDLEKYSRYVREKDELPIWRRHDFRELEPIPDSSGIPQGPKTQADRIAEWMELEHRYGVKLYFEIMPRFMSQAEYKECVLEIYHLGGKRISLWDTYSRAPRHVAWDYLRRVGNRDDAEKYDESTQKNYSWHRFLRIGNMNVSRYLPGWGA